MSQETACARLPKERVPWLDILKLIGILEVFVGHYGGSAGRVYPFVFTHHVALFFFAAGCAEAMDTEQDFWRYFKKKTKGLLIPYFVFGLLSILTVALVKDCGLAEALSPLVGLAAGAVRNRYYMGLWFLTCLYITSLLFWFVKQLRFKPLIFLVCFACGLIRIPNAPCLPYNVDSALEYVVYYALGFLLFPGIQRALAARTHKGRFLLWCVGLLSLALSMLVYFQALPTFPWTAVPVVGTMAAVLRTMLLIWLWVSVSYLLRNAGYLAALGRDTMYDCGNEYIVALVVPEALGLLGVTRVYGSPLAVLLYCALMLVLIHYTLAPMERALIRRVLCWLKNAWDWRTELSERRKANGAAEQPDGRLT